MLHVLNGDGTASRFAGSGLTGDTLVWREVLSEGPAFYQNGETAFWNRRQDYICQTYGVSLADYHRDVQREMEKLAQGVSAEQQEIVLWFEHDLLCQVNLVYLLKWFATQPGLNPGQLKVICLNQYPGIANFKGLGDLTPPQLAGLLPQRETVRPEELQYARQAWLAYTGPDPEAIQNLSAPPAGIFRFLPAALRAHRQRFPARLNGLNRIETTLLELLREQPREAGALFEAFWDRHTIFGLGDTQILHYLRPLQEAGLVGQDDVFSISPTGQQVLNGQQDFLRLYPLDRWLGGCHLHPAANPLRWNPDNDQVGGP